MSVRNFVRAGLFAIPLVGLMTGPLDESALAQGTAGDAAAGQISFHHHCDGCHTILPTDGDGAGPNLDTIMGRKAGAVASFEYSRAMRESGIIWGPENIAQFVTSPNAMVPGNRWRSCSRAFRRPKSPM